MAAVNLQVIPSFFLQFIQKTAFLFPQSHKKKRLWVKKTVLLATMTICASYPIADTTIY